MSTPRERSALISSMSQSPPRGRAIMLIFPVGRFSIVYKDPRMVLSPSSDGRQCCGQVGSGIHERALRVSQRFVEREADGGFSLRGAWPWLITRTCEEWVRNVSGSEPSI